MSTSVPLAPDQLRVACIRPCIFDLETVIVGPRPMVAVLVVGALKMGRKRDSIT